MRVVVLVVMIGFAALGASPAQAQTGGGELDPGYIRATAHDLGHGTFSGAGAPTRAPSVESPMRWSRQVSPLVCVVFGAPLSPDLEPLVSPMPGPISLIGGLQSPGGAPLAPAGAVVVDARTELPPDAVVVGTLVYDVGEQPGVIATVPRCVQPGTPLFGDLPSAAEIWEQTPLPRTAVNASPPGSASWPGITRLATLFWGRPVTDTTANAVIRDFTVNVVAHPVAYAWDFGEGTTLVTPVAGNGSAPVHVTFLRRGDYGVRLFVVWEGRAHISFQGLALADEDLGTVTLPEAAPYHVAEIRALLRTTPGRR